MATSVSAWSTTAASNTEIDTVDISGATGKVKDGDNALRSIMAQVAAYTRRGADLASAATLDLDSVDSLFLNITGTVTVTAVTLTSGHWRIALAAGAFQLTASASLEVNGTTSGSYTTAANDYLLFEGYPSSVVRVSVIGGSSVVLTKGAQTIAGVKTFSANPVLSGGGLSFPATQVASAGANTLDDYEEGTFTPTIIGTTSAGTGTYTANSGRYTKIGDVVHFAIRIIMTAHDGTGNMRVSGLPFTVNSSFEQAVSVYVSDLTFSGQVIGRIQAGADNIRLYSMATGAASAEIALDGACTVMVSGFYFV